MYRATSHHVALVVFALGAAVSSATDPRPMFQKDQPARATHREVPDDPYLPTPPQPPTSQRGRTRWTRGSYVSVQVNVDGLGRNIVGDAANEPSIAVDPTNPNRIVIGWRQFDTVDSNFRQAGWGYSHDGGKTWAFPGVIQPGVFRSDPILAADTKGNIYYNSLGVQGGYHCTVHKSIDGGVSWSSGVSAYGGDKAWMTIDQTDGIGQDNIYAYWTAWNSCCIGAFTRSYDGGLSFGDLMYVPGDPMWGTLSVGPDGELYIAGDWLVAKSSNAQNPAAAPVFEQVSYPWLGGYAGGYAGPNPGGLLGQTWIATDHSEGLTRGNVYVVASVLPWDAPDPLDVMIARSTDGGLTWSDPVRVNDDPTNNGAWQWFGTMSVAPNGRIDVIWNDTRHDPGGYDSELYYAYSIDAGQTWSANEAVSPPFDPHVGWPRQDKIGDYYHAVSDDLGVNVAYAATFNGEQDVYFLRIGSFDCNRNGIADDEDIAGGASDDCDLNGIPDECELDCNDNDVPDTCDIAGGASEDENGNGVPDECDVRWFVDADVPAASDGLTWSTAFNDLQEALAAAAGAVAGGTGVDLRVAEGIYKPAGPNGNRTATFSLIDGVSIRGGYAGFGAPDPDRRDVAAYETILSGDLSGDDGPDFQNRGENSYHVVTADTNRATASLDGFTITAGYANGNLFPSQDERGAGMQNRSGSPTVRNCSFTGNSATNVGGGMLNTGGSPALTNCRFSANSADRYGGGIANYYSDPVVANCTFSGNWAGQKGGGMYGLDSTPTVLHCTFIGNTAGEDGGGMYTTLGTPVLTNCIFSGNSVDGAGGGMYATGGTPALANCTFSGNYAGDGGGMHCGGNATPKLANCAFVQNTAVNGSALGCDSWNQSFPNDVELSNCILWDGADQVWNNDGSTITITFSDVQGGWPGEGNIDADPLFVDADGPDDTPGTSDDNLRLSPGSPCINAGDPHFMGDTDKTDLDGYPRVLCGRVDMGPHEFGIGDFDCNQVVNLADFADWEKCMTGPLGRPFHPGCIAFDFNADDLIDLSDFAGFLGALAKGP